MRRTLNVSDERAVRLIQLNRPEALNAFSRQMMDDLADEFLAAGEDDRTKVVVLTGAGRAFSAGADLKESGRVDPEAANGPVGMLNAIVDFQKPFVVAVNGIGVGIGATICGLADIAFMAKEARLRCPFSALGVTAEAASTFNFPLLMGRQSAFWFLLAGEWMDGSECQRAGLIFRAVPQGDLMPTVMAHANKLASLPLASLLKTKQLIMDPIRPQIRASMGAEFQALSELNGGPANLEAIAAFQEKREPDFSKF